MKIVVGLVVAVIALVVVVKVANAAGRKKRYRERVEMLRRKYRDEDTVQKILSGTIWQGQTPEQIVDTLGRPIDIDQKVLKTKTKEIWKYFQTGKNRFGLKITVENGVVVGWDEKM